MKTIQTQIDCGEKYCGNCSKLLLLSQDYARRHCAMFTDEFCVYREVRFNGAVKEYMRLDECLAAEVKEDAK